MRIQEFEQKVWDTDRIRLVVKGPKQATVQDFDYVHAAKEGMTLAVYMKTRILPRIGDFESSIIDGTGKIPRNNTVIATVRESYKQPA